MADKTGISWTDATWNPVRGCSRVSAGCTNCYAEVQAARIVRMGKGKPTAYDGLVRVTAGGDARWTGVVRLVPEQLAWPLCKKKPLRIFVNSMSDLFHESLTNEQIAAVFGVMAASPGHTFQILTKRARRMREWFEWVAQEPNESGPAWHPAALACARRAFDFLEWDERLNREHDFKTWPLPNVWLGVSVENQDAADERIPELLQTPAAVRFLSCEPLLGKVDLDRDGLLWRLCSMCKGSMSVPVEGGGMACPRCFDHQGIEMTGIDWVIAGCESGPGARPCEAFWLRRLRDDCKTHGAAFFLKQATELITARAAYPSKYAHRIEVRDVVAGDGSKRKPGGVIELPYLDGVQHAAFPGGTP